MEQVFKKELFDGARLLSLTTDRFKTTRITVRFAVPLREKTAAAFAAIPGLLRYTSARYPTNMQTERKLASLYGAGFSGICGKIGDAQILSFTISAVADRFAFHQEAISEECLSFLLDVIMHPDLDENGQFKEVNLKREKRLMKENVMAEMNDKMVYSVNQFNRIFYENEGAALPAYGSLEAIEALCVEDVGVAWKTMLESADIMVCTVGQQDAAVYEAKICEAFQTVQRHYRKTAIRPHAFAGKVKDEREVQPLEQCKLNIGFAFESDNEAVGKVFNTVFGGSEMSLLSLKVREKMSLCYYCSSAFGFRKKILIVYSGVEAANRQRCVDAVLEQLEKIKSGSFDEKQLSTAKRKLKEMYAGLDTPRDIASWYLSQMLDEEIVSPEAYWRSLEAVTKEDVMHFAASLHLDTVYSLGEQ